ncbi:cupin domain-containing protein [Geodermatophilus maliterrae]|uniref:Cupin domain-containing protein n=1 Tax=Geodermatophilus maliterrae TaxID=3162531 RepID=A0ABV3XEH7_9ACTN
MSFFPPPHPYPPDRHSGQGEVSARWRRADAPHDLVTASGSCDYLATGAGTRGDYGLYRWNMGPEPSGPGPHLHRSISESFFVLEGRVRIHDGRGWADAAPGDFVLVPEGGVHGFRNESGEPASMLILFSPGAPREAYFEGLAHLAAGGRRPSDEEMAEFYARHDTWWVDG